MQVDTLSSNMNEENEDIITTLCVACQTGDSLPFQEIVRIYGAKKEQVLPIINSKTVENEYPLTLACKNGMYGVVKLLLEMDADTEVGSLEGDGLTPLMMACDKNHFEIVEILLDYGANIEAIFMSGATSVFIACHLGHEKIAELLLLRGANPNTPDKQGTTGLHIASRKGFMNIVQLLFQHGVDMFSRLPDNRTPWDLAFQYRQEQVLQIFIQNGFDINQSNLLYLACKKRDMWAINWLLRNGADIEARHELVRPLAIAAKNGFWEVIIKLVENGAIVNVVDELGLSPLWHTCNAYYYEVASVLCSKGADPNIRPSKSVKTPLQLIASNGGFEIQAKLRIELAELLISVGADVNAVYLQKNSSGIIEKQTALHIALISKFVPVVKLLVSAGAQFVPKQLLIDEGRAILEKKTVWELANNDYNLLRALALPWCPEFHIYQPLCVQNSILSFLLANKRLEWHLDSNVLHKIFEYVANSWYDYWQK